MSDAASPQVIAQLAEKPPVNAEAVNRIKSAIANGEYPINLDLISDALMDAYRDLKT
jgi:negative regulator of flagellin synthesis FlgM